MDLKNTHIIGITVLLLVGVAYIMLSYVVKTNEREYQQVASTTPITTSSSTAVTVVVSTTTVTTVTKTVVTAPVVRPTVKPTPPAIIQPTIVQSSVVSSTTILIVKPIALLSGGTASAGVSIPVSYLQIINSGSKSTLLSGFTLQQNGSADTDAVIGFVVVDDKGNRVSVGGAESTRPFSNEQAFVPIGVTFVPYEMKLFTIKAIMTGDITDFIGDDLKIDAKSIEATNAVKAIFPIRGTTWVINN